MARVGSNIVVKASAAALLIFGSGWLLLPGMMYKYWAIMPDPHEYMGRRYGAFMLGLAVISWIVSNEPNTRARRAVLIGSLIAWIMTDALSLYGALSLGLNAWPAFGVEFVLVVGFVWVVLVKPEPEVSATPRVQ